MRPLSIATRRVILSRPQSPVAQRNPTWSAPKMSRNAPPIRHKVTPLWFTRLHISSSTPSIWRWMRYGDLRICRRLTTATGSGLRMKKRNTFHCFKSTCNSAVTATVISWPMMGFGRFVQIHSTMCLPAWRSFREQWRRGAWMPRLWCKPNYAKWEHHRPCKPLRFWN